MKHVTALALIASLTAISAPKAETPLEQGLAGALHACQLWVLKPATWALGLPAFLEEVGLGNTIGRVAQVDDISLPPREYRQDNIYWRINSTLGAGYILVVSTRIPMCHITGGGDVDLQPVVAAILASEAFVAAWRSEGNMTQPGGEMTTTLFKHRAAANFEIIVSRAAQPGQRLDRVQVLATATLRSGN